MRYFCRLITFLTEVFVEIIVDSDTVLRNNPEFPRTCSIYSSFPPLVTFRRTTVQYGNQIINTDETHLSHSDLPSVVRAPLDMSVQVVVCGFIPHVALL